MKYFLRIVSKEIDKKNVFELSFFQIVIRTVYTYLGLLALQMTTKLNRGHRELLDGRLCRPDSEQWP